MSKNNQLLDKWIYQTLKDNPGIIRSAKSSLDLYRSLNEIFLEDMQEFMRKMAKEILKVEKQ